MRRVYLVRHGERESDVTGKRYIGITDVPLSPVGKKEAEKLSHYFSGLYRNEESPLIFSSPLKRSLDTACPTGNALAVIPVLWDDFKEINLGSFEGRLISEIREELPKEYKERGEHPGSYRPPGGESFEDAGKRFLNALSEILDESDVSRDVLIFTHSGVIRAALSLLTSSDIDNVLNISIPNASVSCLMYEDGSFDSIRFRGVRPLILLDEKEIMRLYKKYEVPDNVIRHMRAVAKAADEIYESIDRDFRSGNELLIKSALLHDLLRREKNHAVVSADALEKEGYPEIAEIVRLHHSEKYTSRPLGTPLSTEELLFYADKVVLEDKRVSVEERFRESRKKCLSAEALQKHNALYEKAVLIEQRIESVKRRQA